MHNINKKPIFENIKNEISQIEQEINLRQHTLENLENSEYVEIKYKNAKENLIYSERDLFELKHKLRIELIKNLKEIIQEKFKNKEIDENEYTDHIADITKLENAITCFFDMKDMGFNIELFKNAISSYSEYYQKKNQDYNLKQELFFSKMKNLVKSFSLHQLIRKNILKEQRMMALEQDDFSEMDLDQIIDEMYDSIGEKNPIKSTPSMSLDLVKDTLPKYDIKNVSCISDSMTKDQLCQLYKIKNPDNIEIFAIHGFNNQTLGEALGISETAYKQTGGNLEQYNTPLGEMLHLYYFNKNTGKLTPLSNDIQPTPECISREKELTINDNNNTLNINEIATISFSGLKLSFYTDKNGKLNIARNKENNLVRIDTQTLDEMEKSKENKEKRNAKSGEIDNIISNISHINDANELHQSLNNIDFFELIKENVRQFHEKMSLTEKIEAQKQEELDRQRLEKEKSDTGRGIR